MSATRKGWGGGGGRGGGGRGQGQGQGVEGRDRGKGRGRGQGAGGRGRCKGWLGLGRVVTVNFGSSNLMRNSGSGYKSKRTEREFPVYTRDKW